MMGYINSSARFSEEQLVSKFVSKKFIVYEFFFFYNIKFTDSDFDMKYIWGGDVR